MSHPCYEKPSVVAARRLFDEGAPAIPAVLYSVGLRTLMVAGGVIIADKLGAKSPLAVGLSGALVIEAILLLDTYREPRRVK